MSNLEKYQNVFVSCFDLESPNFGQLVYQSISAWDSLGHMSLITELETAFNIMMDMDDVIDFSSYEKGKEILKKYDIEV
jgi:acyl carrier protein